MDENRQRQDELKLALDQALRGQRSRLEALLSRHGRTPSGRPNLPLATSFGVEIGEHPGQAAPLLDPLAAETPGASEFFPVAAAFGWAYRLRAGRETAEALDSLMNLAADDRANVRLGVLEALKLLAQREDTSLALLEATSAQLAGDNLDVAFGAAALVLETFSDPKLIALLRDPEPLLGVVDQVSESIAEAPRAAERLDARRRALVSLSQVAATIVKRVRSGERGSAWFSDACGRARHPDVREALSQALGRLRKGGDAPRAALLDSLRKSLEESAKPLRYAALVRPGTGRGKASRRTK